MKVTGLLKEIAHTMREGCDSLANNAHRFGIISTHTPREGRDALVIFAPQSAHTFQLTRPARGATPRRRSAPLKNIISTHTPREGRDPFLAKIIRRFRNFNSHAPRGAQRFKD